MSSNAIKHASPAAQLSAQVTTAQVWFLASNNQLPAVVAAPGKGILEGKSFTVRAEGNLYSAGATTTAQVTLLGALTMPATPLTAANWTTLGAGTARTVNTKWTPFWFEARLICDSMSGNLQGTFQDMVNNLFDASAVLAAQLSGINGTNSPVTQASTLVPPADPIVLFAMALTFGTAGANLGNLMNFELAF